MSRNITLLVLVFCITQMESQNKIYYPIYFAYNVSDLDTNEQKRLVFFLKNFDSFTIDSISIKGYCDDRGKKKLNDTLAKQRTESIYNVITARIKYSFARELIAIGAVPLEGKSKIDSQRTHNRRAELEIFYSKSKKIPHAIKEKISSPPPTLSANKDSIPDNQPNIKTFLQSAKVGETIDLKIYFEGSSSVIKKTSAPELMQLLAFMKENTKRKIKITGHIFDIHAPTEKDAYDVSTRDDKLSHNRAKKIFTFLVNNEIDKQRVSYEGMAAKFPRGKTPEDDRRVEIVLIE